MGVEVVSEAREEGGERSPSLDRPWPEKYRHRIRDESELMDLLHRAHTVKDQRVAAGYGSAAVSADGSS